MRSAFRNEDLQPLATALIKHAKAHPDDAAAMLDLSTVLLLSGHRELALAAQSDALQAQQLFCLPSSPNPAVRLLVIKAAGDLMANTPVEFLVEHPDVATTVLYVGAQIPAVGQLPDHDVLFVAIGESDDNNPLLDALTDVVANWAVPALNAPERIARLARDQVSRMLAESDGIVMPMSVRVTRTDVEHMYRENTADIAGIALPVIIRPVGSHAGHDLQKVNSAQEAADYCESVRASQFYVAPFIDYRSSDGLYRKYRVMIIQGHAYICHMAISSHWMIHYLNAGMTESEAKRREEARAMENFDNDFAKRHNAALQAITQRVGLDYFGLDCAETQDGKLVIFEVDSNMIVHDMDPIDTFAYKQPVMQKLFAAFRSMLLDAALGKKRGV